MSFQCHFTALDNTNIDTENVLPKICSTPVGFKEVVLAWVTKNQKNGVLVQGGTSDIPATLHQPAIFVTFLQEHKELGFCEFLRSELLEQYPGIDYLDDARCKVRSRGDSRYQVDVCKKWTENRDKKLEVRFDDDYMSDVIEEKHLDELILGIMHFSFRSEVNIWRLSEESLNDTKNGKFFGPNDEVSEEDLKINENYLAINLSVHDPKTGAGFGEDWGCFYR